jgi:hypothetical protein
LKFKRVTEKYLLESDDSELNELIKKVISKLEEKQGNGSNSGSGLNKLKTKVYGSADA